MIYYVTNTNGDWCLNKCQAEKLMLEAFWLCMANNDMFMNASPTVIQLRITVNLRHYITGVVAQRSIVQIDAIAQLAVQRLNELEPGASCGSIPFPSMPKASMVHSHMTVCWFTGLFMFTPLSNNNQLIHIPQVCVVIIRVIAPNLMVARISLNSTSNSNLWTKHDKAHSIPIPSSPS